MNLSHLNFHGDPNIGMYAKASDKFCITGHIISEENERKIQKFLEVDVKKCYIANTDFIGLFSAMNSNGIVLSKLTNDSELKIFNHLSKILDVNVEVLGSRFSAVGNLILANDKGAVVSKLFSKTDLKRIKDCLDVEVVQMKIGGVDVIGSAGIATNKGCLIHRDATEKQIESVHNILQVETDIGTANFGSPFVGSCLISNSKGTLVGDQTTAPEMQRIIDTLKLE